MTDRSHRDALRAPYRTADRREAVRDFVADIPVSGRRPVLRGSAGVRGGARRASTPDPRCCGADGTPCSTTGSWPTCGPGCPGPTSSGSPNAAHLVTLDAPVGPVVARWLDRAPPPGRRRSGRRSRRRRPSTRSSPRSATRPADASPAYDGPDGVLSWADLDARSSVAAHALRAAGLRPGDRVSVLVPPSAELLVAATAPCGRRAGSRSWPTPRPASAGSRRLMRAAAPSGGGTPATLATATALRFAPGSRSAWRSGGSPASVALEPERPAPGTPTRCSPPAPTTWPRIVHTSGATGPAKAVRYTHGALAAQRDVVGPLFGMRPGDAFTTSFGPFMLLAPSLQMTCVRPDFAVDRALRPRLRRAARCHREGPGVTVAWLSPASARTIVATARGRTAPIGLVMLAGAPIPPDLVAGVRVGDRRRRPHALGHDRVPAGHRRDRARGRVGPWGELDRATGPRVLGGGHAARRPGHPVLADGARWGELLVHAPWMFDGYDAAWTADADTWAVLDGRRYHRTGDVGYLHGGLVFHLGRRRHVLDTADGPLASVAVEEPVRTATGRPVAAVGRRSGGQPGRVPGRRRGRAAAGGRPRAAGRRSGPSLPPGRRRARVGRCRSTAATSRRSTARHWRRTSPHSWPGDEGPRHRGLEPPRPDRRRRPARPGRRRDLLPASAERHGAPRRPWRRPGPGRRPAGRRGPRRGGPPGRARGPPSAVGYAYDGQRGRAPGTWCRRRRGAGGSSTSRRRRSPSTAGRPSGPGPSPPATPGGDAYTHSKALAEQFVLEHSCRADGGAAPPPGVGTRRHPADRPDRRSGPPGAAGAARSRPGAGRHHLRRRRRLRRRGRARPDRRLGRGDGAGLGGHRWRPPAAGGAGRRDPARRRARSHRPLRARAGGVRGRTRRRSPVAG